MTECDAVVERMPAVALGTAAWKVADVAHLAACEECALEWRLVQAGAALHADTAVDADRVTAQVLARLRSEPEEARPIRRVPWRGGLIGLLAAAASVALVVWAPRGTPAGAHGVSDTALLGIAPELQGLDDQQLETILKDLEPTSPEVAVPNDGQHLEDLTDAQLEQLLHSMGGS